MSLYNVMEANEDGDLSTEIDDETMLVDTAYENSMNFINVYNSCETVKKFLNRDEYISVRGTTVGSVEASECLKVETDVDGICIEWLDIGEGLDSNFSHVQLVSRDNYIRPVFPMLKKHLNLSEYQNNSLKVLKASVGCQIMYDGGWETWLGFIPVKALKFVFFDNSDQKRFVKATLERVRSKFQKQLKSLLQHRIAIKTLAKNNLNDATKVFVLPDDRRTILQALQRALDVTDLPSGFEKILFSFRFGEKSVRPVQLPIADYSAVRDITVHVGCRIASDEYDLFWSGQGMREVVGERGVITAAFSFKECGNFQSNLDGRCIDISAALRSLSMTGQTIRFIQMYSDLPHRYPKSRMHPVTASVLMLQGLGNALTEESMYKDAMNYLSEIENNFQQLLDGVCRLELVLSLRTSGFMQQTVTGTDVIQVARLFELLERHPLIVPYMKEAKLMDKLQKIGLDLHERLRTAFLSRNGTGDIDTVWECYQIELAVEKLLWGHPFCSASRIYSINLGPGVEYPSRCLTDMMGFLCLSNTLACCSSEDSRPPLQIFSKNASVQRQLMSASGIVNLIGTSSVVLGRRVVLCLLQDFYAVGRVFCRENEFILSLKTEAGNVGKRIVGRISITDLTGRLKSCVKTRFPMVFGSVLKLLRVSGTDIDTILKNGVSDVGLGYFPAFRQHDESRHAYMTWTYNYGYWVISDVSDSNRRTEGEAAELHALILTEMERRKLCHTTMYGDATFPWLKAVLLKVAEKNLTVDQKVQVLTFVSCIALYQCGRYVDFLNLSRLERTLPLGQRMLIGLQVQCRFLMPGVNTLQLFRLHPSIPGKLDMKKEQTSRNMAVESRPVDIQPPEEHEYATERITDDDNENAMPQMGEEEVVPVQHYATSRGYSRWSPRELAIVMEVSGNPSETLFKKFQTYQKRCREENIPDRSWAAFKRKLLRVK